MANEFGDHQYWAIILGGSSGLGLAAARKLAAHGMNLCIVHRDPGVEMEKVNAAFEGLRATGVQVLTFNADVTRADKRAQILDTLQNSMVTENVAPVMGTFQTSNSAGTTTPVTDVFQPNNGVGSTTSVTDAFQPNNGVGSTTPVTDAFQTSNSAGTTTPVTDVFQPNNGTGTTTPVMNALQPSNSAETTTPITGTFQTSNDTGSTTPVTDAFQTINSAGSTTPITGTFQPSNGTESTTPITEALQANAATQTNPMPASSQVGIDPKGEVRCLLHSIARGTLKAMLPETGTALSVDDYRITLDSMAYSLYEWVKDLSDRQLFAADARVLSFTSEGSHRAWKHYGAVSAAKAALEAISRNIALEFAPRGIRANCIQAGTTNTRSLQLIPGSEQLIAWSEARSPFQRLTTPEDVANVVYLLCKDEAAWINGAIIPVDGGAHIC
ncbi:SDR family oxidoreductase [Chitinophaga sp.]|uniref:SDR family oxidoreductase n=1 Tax=Chitinophaga sp. TaxID=1869181 RepID=UPI0031E069A8